MRKWSSRHYGSHRRWSRDNYSLQPASKVFDRPGVRRHTSMPSHASKEDHFRQRHDADLFANRTMPLDDMADRHVQIPDFPGKPSRQKMPDIITSNSIGTSAGKSLGKGCARVELRTGGDSDPHESFYADHFRHDR